MAAEVFPVARIDEYAKPCEPAFHVSRSVELSREIKAQNLYGERPLFVTGGDGVLRRESDFPQP